jgi:hypothetical protein
MIKKTMYCLLTIVVLSTKAQVLPTVGFINYFGDDPAISSVSSGIDGGSKVYTAGRAFFSNQDIAVQCTDSTGMVIWTYTYDNGGYDSPNKIRIDALGNSYITGVSADAATGLDMILIVLDPTGAVIFTKRFDNGFNDADHGMDVVSDANGDVYVTCKAKNGSGYWNAITLKYQAGTGALLWQNTYTGSGFDDIGVCLTFANNQNDVIVAGTSNNGSDADIVVYQLDASTGSQGWVNMIAGTNGQNDNVNAIILAGGNVVIAGMTNNSGTNEDYTTAKIDATNGTLVFQDDYDFSATDEATSLVRDSTGNIGVTGIVYNATTSLYEYHTLLYDSLGIPYWTHKEVTKCNAVNVDPVIVCDTIAHHFYIVGEKENATRDILVYQLTPGGNLGWEKSIDRPLNNSTDVGTSVVVNGLGVLFISGSTTDILTGDFDMTTIKVTQTPVYFPIDFNNANEPPAPNVLFYKNSGEILYSDLSSATDIEYYSRNTSPQFFFAKNSLSFLTRSKDTLGNDSTDRIDLDFIGSNKYSEISRFEIQNEGYLNYFNSHCGGATGITNVKGSRRLMIPEIYPGIDLHYYSNEDGLKFYFVVMPYANPNAIWMNFTGNVATSLGATNDLNISSSLSDFGFKTPKIYNVSATISGPTVTFNTTAVTGALSNISGNSYNFSIGAYNNMFPLVIEMEQKAVGVPTSNECMWSTFYGGTGYETMNGVVTDASGNTFLVGSTDSPNVPNLSGGFVTSTTGFDAFFVKLNASGAGVFGTYFSGNGNCEGFGVGVNSTGKIYLSGISADAAMPVVPTANSSLQGSQDVFLAQFSSTGNSLLFSRFFGGNDYDYNPAGLTIDANDNVYIAGHTHSNANFPFPSSNPSGSFNQSTSTASSSYPDAFVAKFNSSNSLIWSTYFGGSELETMTSIKTRSNGNIVTAGITGSSTRASSNSSNPPCGTPLSNSEFPDCVPSGAFNQNFGGGFQDAFIAEFSSSGALVWSTYVGGAGQENSPTKLALNPANSNEIYLLGNTGKDSWGTISWASSIQYLQVAPSAGARGFISKFTNKTLSWGSFVGDGQNVFLFDGVCDGNGNVYATGNVRASGYYNTSCVAVPSPNNSNDFPKCTLSGVFNQASYGGGSNGDAFLIGFNPSDQLIWSTFYGSAGLDEGKALAFDSFSNKLCFTGNTTSNASGFPLFNPSLGNYQQNSNAGSAASFLYPTGNKDGFFAKFCLNAIPVGLNEISTKESVKDMFLFPNPNNGDFNVTVNIKDGSKFYYEIIDITGKVLQSGIENVSEKSAKFMLAGENFVPGMYFLKINDQLKQTVIKFIIE